MSRKIQRVGRGDLQSERPAFVSVNSVPVTSSCGAHLARLGSMDPRKFPKSVATIGIVGGIGELFFTHPSTKERIVVLRNGQTQNRLP